MAVITKSKNVDWKLKKVLRFNIDNTHYLAFIRSRTIFKKPAAQFLTTCLFLISAIETILNLSVNFIASN